MSNFNNIQEKLHEFVKKYYTNELIKGLILFSSFGLLYFILTVFIEYLLWLNPLARTFLFWVFVAVEIGLLFGFIIRPILKLVGFQKGISAEEASDLIGIHFNEVDDKLLNVIQLRNSIANSELLLASIEQKSKELQPVPFNNAVNFKANTKYLKYLLIPLIIWLITFISGNVSLFSQSYKRVVNYETVYLPPAPFSFNILNKSLRVIEGDEVVIKIETLGKLLPEDVKINFSNQSVYTVNTGMGVFEYVFSSINESVTFYVEGNDVRSKDYTLEVVKIPKILNFEMWVDYPGYTGKTDELIKSTGNVEVPNGSEIVWKVNSRNTDSVYFMAIDKFDFTKVEGENFEFKKRLYNSMDYTISSSNENLKEYESLSFSAKVVKDAFPKIEVRSDIDSLESGSAQFLGQISDDYRIKGLDLVYYDKMNPDKKWRSVISISNIGFEEFYYVFPEGIDLVQGVEYELFFEVFDNDGINGSKSTKSRVFSYYNMSEEELKNQLLEVQKDVIKDLEKSVMKKKEVDSDFKKLQESLQNKSEMNWNDKRKLENFVKRQKQYQEMMQEQTEDLKNNMKNQSKIEDKELEDKKKEIEKRLEEALEMSKQEELLKELERLSEKLDKEQLSEKLKELSKNNRRNERNLERLLELTKRFYVEQKANRVKERIDKLAKEQDKISEADDNNSEDQKKMNSEFEDVKKDLDDLEKENKKLQNPMSFPDTKRDEEKIEEDMKDALDDLELSEEPEKNERGNSKEKKKNARKKQKMASEKMKQMSDKMKSAMESMEGESMDEDIEMLRSILENLVEFSFQQEDLLDDFSVSNSNHPEFANRLKKQNVLKEYFEHIDDSLYTLAMRQPRIGSVVFKELADVHFYLDESLIHLADNQYNVGLSDQQFVVTSTNNIAVLLSDILNSMQNASPSMGKGEGNSFALPDIIQKQEEGMEKMKEGIKNKEGDDKDGESGKDGNSNGNGNKDGQNEELNGELYEIYKEQLEIKEMLENNLKDKKGLFKSAGENAVKQMEQLEKEMLEKGYSNEVLSRMQNLRYKLIKLEEASYKQGEDSKRESEIGIDVKVKKEIKDIRKSTLWFNENELLMRQSLPLQPNYKVRVQNYFRINDSIQ